MIHPTALVHPEARVHPEAEIGPLCYVGAGVTVGRGTRLVGQVWVEGPTVIGEDARISPFAALGGPPQDLGGRSSVGGLVIGDRTQIRESVTVHRGIDAPGTRIGDDCLICAGSHIAHDSVLGNSCVVLSGTVAGYCRLDDHAVIGALALVTQRCHVGAYAFVAAMAKVDRDIPPYTIAQGNDHLTIRGVNLVGLRRHAFPAETLRHLRAAVRVWTTRVDLARAERLQRMAADHGHIPEVRNLIAFLTDRSTPLPAARPPAKHTAHAGAQPPSRD
ncbi:acyl-ACP--UDP-N-acetylglucosamine O-acyltransferase [Streptomyces sp. NPDC127037]|uniref:acyl-ACP--UDP-N-acetylglucosamine O-acyltransferase n=1 Tax=Streptomyces sp. NPDC127037 TaxID=3347113 RepID=UPI003649B34C